MRRVTLTVRGAAAAALALAIAGCSALPHGPSALPSTFIPKVTASAEASPEAVGGFTQLERQALRVRVRTCTKYGTGSAFAIDAHHAVTNRHVAEGATDITLTGFDGATYTGTAAVLSRKADLALITIKGTFPNIVTLAYLGAAHNNVVTIAGYPKGEELVTRQGPFLDLVWDELKLNDDLVGMIDVESHPGNSGSPVANRKGEVVGVLFASDNVHTSYVVDVVTLRFFLANLDKAEKNKADCKAQG